MYRLVAKAIQQGSQCDGGLYTWDIYGDCTSPIPRVFSGRWPKNLFREKLGFDGSYVDRHVGGQAVELVINLRCRKCENCLRNKRNRWLARAINEANAAGRNWFATLTLGSYARREKDPKRVLQEMQREVTLYFKRIRKNSKRKFRYLCVYELHKDGTPHCHLLIHELPGQPIPYRILSQAWRLGFEQHRLLKQDAANSGVFYVCKYLVKSPVNRVRASIHYGLSHSETISRSVKTTDLKQVFKVFDFESPKTFFELKQYNFKGFNHGTSTTILSRLFPTARPAGRLLGVWNGRPIPYRYTAKSTVHAATGYASGGSPNYALVSTTAPNHDVGRFNRSAYALTRS